MDVHASLSERKKQILKAIIDVHIRLGEPVGSKFLTQNEQISLSSATIRNEMAELEEMGYLHQPHASAGRVPSSAGYRLYVDSLMNRSPISSGETETLDRFLKSRMEAFDSVMEQAGKLVSRLTGYTALTMKAKRSMLTIHRFDAVWIDERSFILVMTLDGDMVRSRNLHLSYDVDADVLRELVGILNETIANLTIEEINLPRIVAMQTALGDFAMLLNVVVKHVYEVIGAADAADLRFEGIQRLLDYPEFSDVDSIRALLDVFEQKEEIAKLISCTEPRQVHVILGSETSVHAMENVALLYRVIEEDGHIMGVIGVIGPLRMDYARVIGVIEYMTQRMEEMLGHTTPLLSEAAIKKDDKL